jgi:hypothetical protein
MRITALLLAVLALVGAQSSEGRVVPDDPFLRMAAPSRGGLLIGNTMM